MAGILTDATTGGQAPAPAPAPVPQARPPVAPAPLPVTPPSNTLAANNPLAGMAVVDPNKAAAIHSNPAINEALVNAFRPVIPDQVNSLLGPAIGAMQGRVGPISYVQPRPAPQIATRRSS